MNDERNHNIKIEGLLSAERILNKKIKDDFEVEQKSHQHSLGKAECLIQVKKKYLCFIT